MSHFKLSVLFFSTHKTSYFYRGIQQVEMLTQFSEWKENNLQLQPFFNIKFSKFRLYLFGVERGFIEGSLRVD